MNFVRVCVNNARRLPHGIINLNGFSCAASFKLYMQATHMYLTRLYTHVYSYICLLNTMYIQSRLHITHCHILTCIPPTKRKHRFYKICFIQVNVQTYKTYFIFSRAKKSDAFCRHPRMICCMSKVCFVGGVISLIGCFTHHTMCECIIIQALQNAQKRDLFTIIISHV